MRYYGYYSNVSRGKRQMEGSDDAVPSIIEDRQIIRAILDHMSIWLVRARPPPKIHDPPIREYAAVDLHLQTHADDFYGDPDYSWDEYIQS